MGDRTGISWTNSTWNPVTGCTEVSAGCDHCYAARMARGKLGKLYGTTAPMVDTLENRADPFAVRLWPDRLETPMKWKRPRRIFVNSMSDLFHKDIPEEYVDLVFAVMALAPHHQFQVLTKRPARAARYMATLGRAGAIAAATGSGPDGDRNWPFVRPDDLAARWPLWNVWIGTSVEDVRVTYRLRHLWGVPAAVRFASIEPLIGPVELGDAVDWLDWVIVGGESGPGARPMQLDWARSIRDQCRAAGVAFFMKQTGTVLARELGLRSPAGHVIEEFPEDLRIREYPASPA